MTYISMYYGSVIHTLDYLLNCASYTVKDNKSPMMLGFLLAQSGSNAEMLSAFYMIESSDEICLCLIESDEELGL